MGRREFAKEFLDTVELKDLLRFLTLSYKDQTATKSVCFRKMKEELALYLKEDEASVVGIILKPFGFDFLCEDGVVRILYVEKSVGVFHFTYTLL